VARFSYNLCVNQLELLIFGLMSYLLKKWFGGLLIWVVQPLLVPILEYFQMVFKLNFEVLLILLLFVITSLRILFQIIRLILELFVLRN